MTRKLQLKSQIMSSLLLTERVYLLNIDFTSERDNLLILSASIPFFGRVLPIFFTIRNYPKSKNKLDQKKMEEAFLLRLRHLLPKKFQYIW